jgi:hypothetical protein
MVRRRRQGSDGEAARARRLGAASGHAAARETKTTIDEEAEAARLEDEAESARHGKSFFFLFLG